MEGALRGLEGLWSTAGCRDRSQGEEGRLGGCRPWWLQALVAARVWEDSAEMLLQCFSVSQSSCSSAQSQNRRGQVGGWRREEGFGKVVWEWGE